MKNYVFISDEHYKIAEENGIDRVNLYNRVVRCYWDIERAITVPLKKRKTPKYILDRLKRNGISNQAFYNRVHNMGWSIERASTEPINDPKDVLAENRKVMFARSKIKPHHIETAKKNGIGINTLKARVSRYKWSVEEAISKPLKFKSKHRKAI